MILVFLFYQPLYRSLSRSSGASARVVRDGAIIYTGKISTIFREKDQAKQVSNGQECGITLKDFVDFQKNDTIEAYSTTSTERTV